MQKNGGIFASFSRAGLRGSAVRGLYDFQNGWKVYLLSGGTAGMKTALLQKIKKALEERGEQAEVLFSPLDIGLWEGLRVPGAKVCVLDGLHYGGKGVACPGIGERVVGLDDCLDEEVLSRHAAKALVFHARCLAAEERAARFLAAEGNLLTDNTRLALENADLKKIDDTASRLVRRLFPKEKRPGTESVRFLTAVTADGVQNLCPQTAAQFAHIYILEDGYGVGKVFLSRLREAALASGQPVVSCPCGLFPRERPEHLLFPAFSTAFFTSSRAHPVEGYRRLHMRRFLDHDAMTHGRPRVSFNRRAAKEMERQAVALLNEARQDRLAAEEGYAAALRPGTLEELSARLAEKIGDRAQKAALPREGGT